MKRISDRPGRYFALIVFGPTLIMISRRIGCTHPRDANTLLALGTLLIAYESFWVLQTTAELT
jgi:hypothetical protein